MATQNVYPSAKQLIGFNKEVTQGTAVTTAPAFTLPIDSVLPEPKPTWLDNMALYNDMAAIHGRIQGPLHEEIAFQGPAFMDILPLLLNNILGDITSSGTLPVSHAISLLNSGTAQPGSLTMVAWSGMPATGGSRVYPGVCLSELTIAGNADSALITYQAKGMSWISSDAASAITYAPTPVQPMASWRYALGLAGPASGGTQNKTVRDFSLTIARQLRAENVFQNSQNPALIVRGNVDITCSLTSTVPGDETFVTYLLANTQPQLQLIGDIGTGATNYGMTIDMQQAAWDTNAIKTDEEVLGYNGTVRGIANTTNAGASGGMSPIKVTIRNQTATGSY